MIEAPSVDNSDLAPLELPPWGVRFHVNIFRAACRPLEWVASKIFDKISPPICSIFDWSRRKFTIVDVSYITVRRGVNGVAVKVLKQDPMDPESLKTYGQRQRDREIIQYREELGVDSIEVNFSRVLATFINRVIPQAVGEKLSALPEFAEGLLLFKLGLLWRYANRQLCDKTGYRNWFLASKIQQIASRVFGGIRTRFAHFFLSSENIAPIASIEHFLLKLCTQAREQKAPRNPQLMISRAIESLGQSLSQQPQIDAYITAKGFRSSRKKLIARLEWHADNNSLPQGAPDPRKVRLTVENVEKEFESAMYSYLKEIVGGLLDKLPIEGLKKISLFRLIYFLEGKASLKEILTSLILEVGIKQLVDPHLFACAILYAIYFGNISELEQDGFGMGKTGTIFETGQQMMAKMLVSDFAGTNVTDIFNSSKLKVNPGGTVPFEQKKAAKRELRKYIKEIIHNIIKGEGGEYRHDGLFKRIREKVSQLPVVGTAATTLHLVMNSTLFALQYPFRGKKQAKVSLFEHLFKHLAGEPLAWAIADWIVDLIYHPSWKITVLQLIEALVAPIKPQEQGRTVSQDDLGIITNFLIERLLVRCSVPTIVRENLTPLASSKIAGSLHSQVLQMLKPSNVSLTENVMRTLLPSIKELLLYNQVVEAFRKVNIHFEGDKKFWEIYLRVGLNRLVARRKESDPFNPKSLVEIRDEFVEILLNMHPFAIGDYFADITAAAVTDINATAPQCPAQPFCTTAEGDTLLMFHSYHPSQGPPALPPPPAPPAAADEFDMSASFSAKRRGKKE